jgi:hypothetical protein
MVGDEVTKENINMMIAEAGGEAIVTDVKRILRDPDRISTPQQGFVRLIFYYKLDQNNKNVFAEPAPHIVYG